MLRIYFWLIETFNWLLFGFLFSHEYKVYNREEYDWFSSFETEGWQMCHNIVGSTNSRDEIWMSIMGYGIIFPKHLQKKYYLTYRNTDL